LKHSTIEGVKATRVISLLAEKGIDWNSYPYWFRHGTLLKKRMQKVQALNPIKNTTVETNRGVISFMPATVFYEQSVTPQTISLMQSKTVNEDSPFYKDFENLSTLPTNASEVNAK
jgi:hypothetical protein